MKSRLFIRIAVISSIVLLCASIGLYSYSKLSAMQGREEFNLYSLVPPDAHVLFETDDLSGFMADFNELSSSKSGHELHLSRLFSVIRSHFHLLIEEMPHGLSEQMNKMLVSFHTPDDDRSQVFYCSLGEDDPKLMETFIYKYFASPFPSKLFDYKGEEIRIYPMSDGDFLACYFTSRFFVVSYQKRLIEKVIDARLSGKSLFTDSAFKQVYNQKRKDQSSTVYIHMLPIPMGKSTDGIRSFSMLGGWMGFDLKMNGDAVYLSGASHDVDTCLTFMNALRRQAPVEGFPGDVLPASTFMFSKRAVSDLQTMLNYTFTHEYATATYSNYIHQRDEEMLSFLKDNIGTSVTSCLFHAPDSIGEVRSVMSIPMVDSAQAERMLRNVLASTPHESDTIMPRSVLFRTGQQTYTFYAMPQNTLFARFTGITESSLHTSSCFYHGRLLIAPDVSSLSDYIHFLDRKQVLVETPAYEEEMGSLSPTYSFMLKADLSDVFTQPENYVRLIPAFFFQNQDYFSRFILLTQFTYTDGEIYPNIILLYKDK
ncbi:DUF3352 domain-containing protein [uncultured Bacteroides sp.]|uniref:DUF3352 domain-containing protein n=1 Tax=uncultured Bacteroides sp. TaxID=162156 RepID=UPI002AA6FAB8|nr:DUF3352 domain-containing protein [uncultured Bacteroides sp.]